MYEETRVPWVDWVDMSTLVDGWTGGRVDI